MRNQEPPSSAVLCRKDDKGKTKLEELQQPNQAVTLLSLGDVKYDIPSYLKAHPNIQILEMSTKHIKKREKGPSLKVRVTIKTK